MLLGFEIKSIYRMTKQPPAKITNVLWSTPQFVHFYPPSCKLKHVYDSQGQLSNDICARYMIVIKGTTAKWAEQRHHSTFHRPWNTQQPTPNFIYHPPPQTFEMFYVTYFTTYISLLKFAKLTAHAVVLCCPCREQSWPSPESLQSRPTPCPGRFCTSL